MSSRWILGVLGVLVVAGTAGVLRAEGDGYSVRLPGSVDIEPGQAHAVSLTLAPAAGREISSDAPLRVDLQAEPKEGLQLVRSVYQRRDAADPRADAPRFELRLRAKTSGTYRLRVRLRFWLCRKKTCVPIDTHRELQVSVRSPADAGPLDAGS